MLLQKESYKKGYFPWRNNYVMKIYGIETGKVEVLKWHLQDLDLWPSKTRKFLENLENRKLICTFWLSFIIQQHCAYNSNQVYNYSQFRSYILISKLILYEFHILRPKKRFIKISFLFVCLGGFSRQNPWLVLGQGLFYTWHQNDQRPHCLSIHQHLDLHIGPRIDQF